jgi:hypothetical protein
MAQFRGTLQGSRKEKSCLGHKTQGLIAIATVSGWRAGIRIEATHDQQDLFRVIMTGGSAGHTEERVLGCVIDEGGEPVWLPQAKLEEREMKTKEYRFFWRVPRGQGYAYSQGNGGLGLVATYDGNSPYNDGRPPVYVGPVEIVEALPSDGSDCLDYYGAIAVSPQGWRAYDS